MGGSVSTDSVNSLFAVEVVVEVGLQNGSALGGLIGSGIISEREGVTSEIEMEIGIEVEIGSVEREGETGSFAAIMGRNVDVFRGVKIGTGTDSGSIKFGNIGGKLGALERDIDEWDGERRGERGREVGENEEK